VPGGKSWYGGMRGRHAVLREGRALGLLRSGCPGELGRWGGVRSEHAVRGGDEGGVEGGEVREAGDGGRARSGGSEGRVGRRRVDV
jgi:hypothetical protein